MGRFTNKAVIVTGSGRGLGRAIALAFAREGADVIVNVSKSVEEMGRVVDEIRALGARAVGVVADVSRYHEAEKLVKTGIEHFGKVDVLVNNAGIARPAMCYRMAPEDWKLVIDVNVNGYFNCIRAVAPHMIERRYGKIINISSIASRDGFIGNSNYSASKGAIDALTRTAAKELGRYGINVNAIAPGIIEGTKLTEWLGDPKFAELRERYLSRIPLNRFGKPEDVTPLALFLASDEASYITGQIIAVDGGGTAV